MKYLKSYVIFESKSNLSFYNNSRNDMEKDFLKIIDKCEEIDLPDYKNDKLIFSKLGPCLFQQHDNYRTIYYSYELIHKRLQSRYDLSQTEINEFLRHMIGKYLKLDTSYDVMMSGKSGIFSKNIYPKNK